jgi:signal transduction histidine kinase
MIVRVATAALILALVTLLASALFWPTTTANGSLAKRQADETLLAAADPEALLRAFEDATSPLMTVDVGAIYTGRAELIDPQEVLPTWHRHARAEAALVFEATRSCPPRPLPDSPPLSDVALVKAYSWFARTCQGGGAGPPPEDLLAMPPFMHPSGKSYAAMALAHRGDDARAFATRNWKKLHVLELAQSGADVEEARALAGLGSREWLGLSRGDRLVQTNDRLVIANRGPLGLTQLRFHPRISFASDMNRASARSGASASANEASPLVLVPRSSSPIACGRAASSLLCWEVATAPRRSAVLLQRLVLAFAAVMAVASIFALGLVFVRERRRAALDRLHLLRTLTHEVRTPATALVLDIEPLRAAYDELPLHLQEPLLRISGGIARLSRVLHHSARTLQLFEGKGELASPITIESTHEMLKDFAAEWSPPPTEDAKEGEEVTLICEGDDGAITTDPGWLAVALRNLVENACKYGKAPVVVRARLGHDALIIRVEDAGNTPEISLRRATTAWTRLTTTATRTAATQSNGLGLGLALVARIAKALGGTLTHEPLPTAFVLRIPRASARTRTRTENENGRSNVTNATENEKGRRKRD